MKSTELAALLATVTGHLHTATPEEEEQLKQVQQLFGQAVLTGQTEPFQNQTLLANSSDLFFTQNIRSERLTKINDIVSALQTGGPTDDLRVFVRDKPIRTTRIPGSVPAWAAGAQLVQTVGPLMSRDGRRLWFDVFRAARLVALQLDGQSTPILLFTAKFQQSVGRVGALPRAKLTKEYPVVAGSVWIRANVLAADAPADRYCGLRVTGGQVTLDIVPKLQNNRLVAPPGATVQATFLLKTPNDPSAGVTDAQGTDARQATFHLPGTLQLTCSPTKNTLNQVGSAGWIVYNQQVNFGWQSNQAPVYNAVLGRVLIPMKADETKLEIRQCDSPFNTLSGQAPILQAYWGLPAATLNITHPLEASGSGALLVACGPGLRSAWVGLENGEARLATPLILGEPGRISLGDLATNAEGLLQHLDLWKDEVNPHGTSADFFYLKSAGYIYECLSKGDEGLTTACRVTVNTDRPIQANGEPVAIRASLALLVLASNAQKNLVYLFSTAMQSGTGTLALLPPVVEQAPVKPPRRISLVLENALFTTTEVVGCQLLAECSPDWSRAERTTLLVAFKLFSYLPTLPDPYAANLGIIERIWNDSVVRQGPSLGLIGRITQKPGPAPTPGTSPQPVIYDSVKVSFHFGEATLDDLKLESLANSLTGTAGEADTARFTLKTLENAVLQPVSPLPTRSQPMAGSKQAGTEEGGSFNAYVSGKPNYEARWRKALSSLGAESFALLDVSTNAHLLGVSFGNLLSGGSNISNGLMAVRTATATATDATDTVHLNPAFPFAVQDMAVYTQASSSRLFMLPQVAWEPVLNVTPAKKGMDPPLGPNYYPDDGGPTRLINNSLSAVRLAPIPVKDFILEQNKSSDKSVTLALFTLPFGMRAVALLSKLSVEETDKPTLTLNEPIFGPTLPNGTPSLKGGIQINAQAGNFGKRPVDPGEEDSPMFLGMTIQTNNIQNLKGTNTATSTLGDSVTTIFNNEFFLTGNPKRNRGVPVSRIDFSGYGASMFSNWLSPTAAIAETSQACFEVMRGRTAHEVVQVKSILYPWGIRVVRTITLFRTAKGYVYRYDSGWQAESAGKFDFRYRDGNNAEQIPYEIHPGTVRGLFNVRNIREDASVAPFTSGDAVGQAVWFDADVGIESLTQGGTNGQTPSAKILGYVQTAPTGKPWTPKQFTALLFQQGSIGGPVDCTVNVNKSDQQMRINRFDVNAATDNNGQPIFVVAIRGSVILPSEGSWSLVQHRAATGEVVPLPDGTAVPLIRIGQWVKNTVIDEAAAAGQLLRIANPADLVRAVASDTLNFGFLQSTATQKALFLTPAYAKSVLKILSKTPPLFADAYRLMTGNGIFPNVGDAVSSFGDVMPLLTSGGVPAFGENALEDGGKKVLELLEIKVAKNPAGTAVKQGLLLANKIADGLPGLPFDVPSFDVPLVEMGDVLKIYIEYKTSAKDGSNQTAGKLDFNIDSLASNLADTWKSRLNNLSMVVDLGPMERLMTIKGNFDARKGKESSFEGDVGDTSGLPTPEIEFSDALQPVIDILEILASLSTGDYGDVMKKGLKIAMSNSGEVWEYKYEATKDIPLVRFPPLKAVYDSPQTPLKLEASMSLGVYFNAALKVTTDPKQLLPTAGAFLQFHGGLSVMCVSLAAATIYAVGSVDLRIACDTKIGPSLDMKFGFGAQIAVGLPVVGNVSVLYMVGVEMHAETGVIRVAAFMLFRGHAELLGGLVGVTITIEAKGIVERNKTLNRTDCTAQVTFALDISIFLVIDISFSKTWSESRQIA